MLKIFWSINSLSVKCRMAGVKVLGVLGVWKVANMKPIINFLCLLLMVWHKIRYTFKTLHCNILLCNVTQIVINSAIILYSLRLQSLNLLSIQWNISAAFSLSRVNHNCCKIWYLSISSDAAESGTIQPKIRLLVLQDFIKI